MRVKNRQTFLKLETPRNKRVRRLRKNFHNFIQLLKIQINWERNEEFKKNLQNLLK